MKFVPGVLVRANKKGWMNEALTEEWLHKVWNRRPRNVANGRSMLVWDSFRAHITDPVKNVATKMKTDLNVIPGGLTSLMQPLDVSLNKPFKDRMKSQWNDWMLSGKGKLTAGGNLAKPDLPTVVKWVKDAWESIPKDMVVKSFLKCGIANKLNGTEDHHLYEDDDGFADATLELDDPDDYTADVEMLDGAYEMLFPSDDESEIDDDMPDETFQILNPSDDEEQ